MSTDTYEHAKESAENAGVNVRWMIRRDMPRVLEIENLCFEFPWTEETFIGHLRKRNAIAMVADCRRTQKSVGYVVYELHKHRLDVLNLAVEPARQRKGIGVAIVAKLKAKLHPARRMAIRMDLRESNLDGQLFLRRQGFRAVETLKELYWQTDEDAYRFEFRIAESEV